MLLKSSEVSGEHVSGQVEVFKGVEGDVSVVDHRQHHRDVSTLGGQELDGSQVGDWTVETERPQEGNQFMLSDSRERRLNSFTMLSMNRLSFYFYWAVVVSISVLYYILLTKQ